MTRQFTTLLMLAGLLPAFAHDLYLMPENFVVSPGAQLRLIFQNGDEFPEGTSSVKLEKLRNTRLVSRGDVAEFENMIAEAKRTIAMVRVPAEGIAILTAQTIPTFIELNAKKFVSYLEHENLTNAVKWREDHGETNKPGRERYSKFVKSMILAGKPDGYYREPAGLTIEIIPEVDPYSLNPGATLHKR